jgi:cytochrome c556
MHRSPRRDGAFHAPYNFDMLSNRSILIASITAILGGGALAAEPPKRAAPPVWTPEVESAFFDDARDALEGERPIPGRSLESAPMTAGGAADPERFEWSRLISADALATEVKRVAASLAEPLATASAFKSGGNKTCLVDFSELAVLWAVIEQYDGEVRWQRDAAVLRNAFARAARNCKSASDQTFAEATERRAALEDLIRGGRTEDAAAEPVEKWSGLAERGPLMQRMQTGLQEGINPKLSDARAFSRAAADVQHEAQMLALLAEIIRRQEFEYWDDETFNEYADELGAAATDLSRAAADNNYEAARGAAGRAGQACAACHDGYRN